MLRAKVATCGGTNKAELRVYTKIFSSIFFFSPKITLLTCFQYLKANKIHFSEPLKLDCYSR